MAGPKLTFDTNAFLNLFDKSSQTATSVEELEALFQLSLSGRAEISITTRTELDIGRDKNVDRRASMLQLLNMMPVIGSVFRLGISCLGSDILTDSEQKIDVKIQQIVFPGLTTSDRRYANKQNDIDHLAAHYLNSRDVFVTDDKELLQKREPLMSSLGIKLMNPREALELLRR